MIKCDWFLKLLKPFFSILLISFSIFFVSFSSASYVSDNWYVWTIWQFIENWYTNSYQNSVVRKWWLITQVWQVMKNVFYTNTNKFIFWNAHWLPYVFSKNTAWTSIQWQWVPKYYYFCNLITDSNSYPNRSNCTSYEISDSSSDIIASFLATLTNSDKFYYNWHNPSNVSWVNALCFSSESYWNSLCFFQCGSENNDISGCPTGSKSYMSDSTLSFTTSNSNFDSLDSAVLFDPPGWWWWNNEVSHGSSEVNIDSIFSWDFVYSTCTNWEIINYLELAWYNKYFCYWWLDNFDLFDSSLTYNPVPWTWKTLEQILSYSNAWTPKEWFVFWNWLRWWYDSMWSSYPAVYKTRFDIFYQYWWWQFSYDFLAVKEYCLMKIVLDIDYSNTYPSNWYLNKLCPYIKMDNSNKDSSGNIVDWVNWEWVWNNSWTVVKTPSMYIQDFFNKLKENFPTRYDLGGWFLPVYIITFLCALILFRFLRH